MAIVGRLVIGTRGSPLAIVQAEMVRAALLEQAGPDAAPDQVVLRRIQTTGDAITDRTLQEAGGKGLFTKEIDEALLKHDVDLAVHSMKDVPTLLPDGIVIAAVLERADPRDVLIARQPTSLADLPPGTVLGTASLRRQAQVLAARPDVQVVPLRGNVGTRLTKLERGEVGATLLAAAGLARLGTWPDGAKLIEVTDMLPAVAQGAIGIACRADDRATRDRLAALDHPLTHRCILAERAMLTVLDGSCRTPIAAFARLADGDFVVDGLLAAPDGGRVWRARRSGTLSDAIAAGDDLGRELLVQSGKERSWN